uniref:5-methylcytosine restriction system specificity protein McrC n=1 Tax=Paenarthrobacter ureafaciens TaxID=37931 RepID=UPI003F49855F
MRVETIRLQEYETTLIDDEIVQLVDDSFWAEVSVSATRHPKDDRWRMKAESLSGIARYRSSAIDLTVVIEPKLKAADVLFLAEHAYGQRVEVLRRPKSARVGIDSTYPDPIAALLIWYVDAVADFATRWLRRSYRAREVVLSGQVRGRFLVSKYVTQSLATARNADVPCVITERTIDTANNRVLKAGLREVAKLSSALAVPGARMAVKSAVNAALPLFAEVSDTSIGPRELRATSVRGSERHYASILETTADLLGGRHLGAKTGANQVSSFMWAMPALFQEALRGILEASEDFRLDKSKRPSAKIYDGSDKKLTTSKIDPDYVIRTDNEVMLFDAKYKESLKIPGNEEESLTVGTTGPKIRVSRSDIYQMAAYRQQPLWLGAKTALIYPIVLAAGQTLPKPYEVRGIGPAIRLHFMDVGPNARENLASFREQIAPEASLA